MSESLEQLKSELRQYQQATYELHSEIRNALGWIENVKGEPSVALAALRRTADRWQPLLEPDDD